MPNSGTLYGIGVGPGDPALLTLKAIRRLVRCPLLAYPCNSQGVSQARGIVSAHLRHQPDEMPIPLAFDGDREAAARAYDQAAESLASALRDGRDVALLCEGDPLLFGSFIYLLQRLGDRFPVEVIPGIPALAAGAAAARLPLTLGDQALALLPGNSGDDDISEALRRFATVVFYKPGRQRARLLRLIDAAGRGDQWVQVSNASRPEQHIDWCDDADTDNDASGPYFSLLLVSRNHPPRHQSGHQAGGHSGQRP
jgi:precorrin-2/cobalt-factor-2 C20-methyltransferase